MIKKIVKVIVIYIFFIVIAVVINACGGVSVYCEYSGINSKAIRLVDIETHIDNSDYYYYSTIECINSLDTVAISYDSLGIEVTASSEENIDYALHFNNSVFIKSCYADETYDGEKILGIMVTSNRNYNQDFLAGSDLSAIMNITYGHSINGISFKSFLTSYDCQQGDVLLRFILPPNLDRVHTITIKYITEHGNVFETTQGKLLITK